MNSALFIVTDDVFHGACMPVPLQGSCSINVYAIELNTGVSLILKFTQAVIQSGNQKLTGLS